MTREKDHQDLRSLSVQIEDGFSPDFCVCGVDKSFVLHASLRFFPNACHCAPVSKLVLDETLADFHCWFGAALAPNLSKAFAMMLLLTPMCEL